MTDSFPDPVLDELVAAYLDGEATADERARVQNDRALLARADELRAVSKMVAEPVALPDVALRNAHIEAALVASSTSAVVTALPSNRRKSDLLRFASIAAVVLAIMVAVPLVLSTDRGSDDDTAATEATSADDGLAAMDAVADSGTDGAAEMAAAPEPADEAGEEAAADGLAESTDEPLALEDDDGLAPMDAVADADIEAALGGVPRIDLDDVGSRRALQRQVERRLAAEPPDSTDERNSTSSIDGLACGQAIAAEVALRGPAQAVGTAIFDGVVSEYIIVSNDVTDVIVLNAATCAVRAAG